MPFQNSLSYVHCFSENSFLAFNAQSDPDLRCPHMPEDTFTHGAAQLRSHPPTRNDSFFYDLCRYLCFHSLHLLISTNDLRFFWVAMTQNVPSDMCAQRRLRLAFAFAQSDQNLHRAHFE